mmetsp:Transcript_11420/g.32415  ORF Transcript_11420/g.32415 Transcript_11420/m.32415 type:complete len:421 (-) Transcript_11420:497-1759(-)
MHGTAKRKVMSGEEVQLVGLESLGVELMQCGAAHSVHGYTNPELCCWATPQAHDARIMGSEAMVTLVPWAKGTNSGDRVVAVICNPGSSSLGKSCTCISSDTRSIAWAQLLKLHAMGYELHSSFDPSFQVCTVEGGMPGVISIEKMQNLRDEMITAGCYVKAVHEFVDGRWSGELGTSMGLCSADATFRFKGGVRELLSNHGVRATFMSRPFTETLGNSMDFRHAVRPHRPGAMPLQMGSEGQGLNALARHWVGGVQEHGPALAALCAPTVNCYRHIQSKKGVMLCSYSTELQEGPMVRVMPGDHNDEAVFENRLSCSAANPYLVMAATVAAGIDGLARRLEPKAAALSGGGREDCKRIPKNLISALEALRKDSVIVEALGQGFVDYYLSLKEAEVAVMKGTGDDASILAMERQIYITFL